MSGIVGSSVNFTWTFSGDLGVARLEKQKDDGSRESMISINKAVKTNIHSPYHGRVSAVWNGKSPGQVTFTLNLISVVDEDSYICRLDPVDPGQVSPEDTVQLIVLGKRA